MLQHSMTQTAVATLGLHVCSHTQSHHHTHSSPPPPSHIHTYKHAHSSTPPATDMHTELQIHTQIQTHRHTQTDRRTYKHTNRAHTYPPNQPQKCIQTHTKTAQVCTATDRQMGRVTGTSSQHRQAGRQAGKQHKAHLGPLLEGPLPFMWWYECTCGSSRRRDSKKGCLSSTRAAGRTVGSCVMHSSIKRRSSSPRTRDRAWGGMP